MGFQSLSKGEKKVYSKIMKDVLVKLEKSRPKSPISPQRTYSGKVSHHYFEGPNITLGEFVKEKRILADLTQSELAEALGYKSPQFISNLERDLTAFPLEKMAKLANLIEVSIDEIKAVLIRRYASKLDEIIG